MTQDVYVIDDQHPEDLAMLQALYSRSPASVVTHLEKLKQSGSGKFMDQYYVGYGHSSIGDCGTTTVFIEQVSMLVAKAVQDNPLYNGQEASTRYLDFSRQQIIDPYNNAASAAIQGRWLEIYNRTLPQLVEALRLRYPFDALEYKNERIWTNTLQARAFDIARAFLPIGTTTLLSWTTTLRSARDNLRRLKYHPLPEVQGAARTIFAKMLEKYPHSFKGDEMDASETTRDAYTRRFATRTHFASVDDIEHRFAPTDDETAMLMRGDIVAYSDSIDLGGLRAFESATLSERPEHAHLPWRLESYGRYNFLFLLDFGSFRDLQRHRNGVCQIPLVDGRYGLSPWYLAQFETYLPAREAAALAQDIATQFSAIAELPARGVATTPLMNQYLYPMGTQAMVHASYSLPETVYIGELRSSKTVHPSLRPVAQRMLNVMERDLPGIALYGDRDSECWDARRGEQTIASKVA